MILIESIDHVVFFQFVDLLLVLTLKFNFKMWTCQEKLWKMKLNKMGRVSLCGDVFQMGGFR